MNDDARFSIEAQPGVTVTSNGGGQGTYGYDADGLGSVDGTHFGFGVVIAGDGSARGHFLCLMAGNATPPVAAT